MHIRLQWLLLCGMLGSLTGGIMACNKAIEIHAPDTSIPQSQVFATDQEAIGALAGAYYKMANSYTPTLLNGAATIYPALSADELIVYDQGNNAAVQFNQNALLVTNPFLSAHLWSSAYQSIYQFNAILENVHNTTSLTPSLREQLTGQAYFCRALLHYHLASLFEAIPLVTSTNWRTTSTQPQSQVLQLYARLITDLEQARKILPADYQLLQGGKLIANKYAATALLARMQAQVNNWEEVAMLTDDIINSNVYALPKLHEVFTINSPEVILQWQQDPNTFTFNATCEGMTLLPMDGVFPFPTFAYVSPSLLTAFEANDQRKAEWLKQRTIDGKTFYYPYKYKIGPSQAIPSEPLSEGYAIIRLAEMYLLRAEARLELGNLSGSIDDINNIRMRANLPPLPHDLTQQEIRAALQQERRIELFCEWGHRWIDLKRWGKANNILEQNKGFTISPHALLYPIPATELSANPVLKQNPGY